MRLAARLTALLLLFGALGSAPVAFAAGGPPTTTSTLSQAAPPFLSVTATSTSTVTTPAATTATTTAARPSGNLPFTGDDLWGESVAAVLLVAGGVLLRVRRRPRW